MVDEGERSAGRRFIAAGIVLGLAVGGFFDGIVLHQLLQWHHMISAVRPATTLEGLEVNTLADGLFHAGTYVFLIIGLTLLWSAARQRHVQWSTPAFVGALLAGWGLFNVLDSLIDHHLLGLHHIRPGPNQLAWDLGFLAWGVVMLVAGGLLMLRTGPRTGIRDLPGGGRRREPTP